jgi:hypothetical protein
MTRNTLTTLGCIIALAATGAVGAATPVALTQAAERPTVTVEVHGNGFHWGDAAIGGVVVAGAVIAAGGVALATRRPQNRHTDRRPHD